MVSVTTMSGWHSAAFTSGSAIATGGGGAQSLVKLNTAWKAPESTMIERRDVLGLREVDHLDTGGLATRNGAAPDGEAVLEHA